MNIMNKYKYIINGTTYEVTIGEMEENVVNVNVNGEDYRVEKEPEPEKPKPVVRPVAAAAAAPAPSKSSSARTFNEKVVKAPLPGVIVELKVNVGDTVKAGDTVVVLEAMKMANNLEAECSGKVAEILVQPGQTVMEDDVLIVIELSS